MVGGFTTFSAGIFGTFSARFGLAVTGGGASRVAAATTGTAVVATGAAFVTTGAATCTADLRAHKRALSTPNAKPPSKASTHGQLAAGAPTAGATATPGTGAETAGCVTLIVSIAGWA